MRRAFPPAQILDSVWEATHGCYAGFSGLFRHLSPSVNHFLAAWEEDKRVVCSALVSKPISEQAGQLGFLLAEAGGDLTAITGLLEELVRASGEWETRYLLCDLPEASPFLPAFRQADFTVWEKQRLFHCTGKNLGQAPIRYTWRTWSSADLKAMAALHRDLVPKLFQPIEPMTRKAALGMVLYDQHDTLLGYADLDFGPRGIWVQPFLSLNVDDPVVLLDLVRELPGFYKRPVTIAARSYQPWLEELLLHLDLEPDDEQALLVRYLVIQEKAFQPALRQVFEKNQGEGSVPVAQVQRRAKP